MSNLEVQWRCDGCFCNTIQVTYCSCQTLRNRIIFQVVKVCDFGVARLKPSSLNAAEKSEKFSAEMTAETGTYRWMSPEVHIHL